MDLRGFSALFKKQALVTYGTDLVQVLDGFQILLQRSYYLWDSPLFDLIYQLLLKTCESMLKKFTNKRRLVKLHEIVFIDFLPNKIKSGMTGKTFA